MKNSTISSKRIDTFDIAKGIGIILMVFGHTFRGYELKAFIYTFHIPLFFVVSGLFFNITKYKNFSSFFSSKFRSLILPYFTFYLISFIYWLFVERYLRPGYDIDISIPLIGLFYGTDLDKFMAPNGALWFLTCLFSVEIIMYFVLKSHRRIYMNAIIICLMALAGYILSIIEFRLLPFSLTSALFATLFFGVGYYFKEVKRKFLSLRKLNAVIVCAASMLVVLVISRFNGVVDMDYMKYGNPLLFVVGALIGVCGILAFSKLITSKSLVYLGQNSLIILGLSEPIKRAVIGLYSKVSDLPVADIRLSILHSGIIVLIVILILLPAIHILNKYLPFLLGKKASKKEVYVRLSNQQ